MSLAPVHARAVEREDGQDRAHEVALGVAGVDLDAACLLGLEHLVDLALQQVAKVAEDEDLEVLELALEQRLETLAAAGRVQLHDGPRARLLERAQVVLELGHLGGRELDQRLVV